MYSAFPEAQRKRFLRCHEVQRVLNVLGNAWVINEDVLFELSVQDLRSLDVTRDFFAPGTCDPRGATVHRRRHHDAVLDFVIPRSHNALRCFLHFAVVGRSPYSSLLIAY